MTMQYPGESLEDYRKRDHMPWYVVFDGFASCDCKPAIYQRGFYPPYSKATHQGRLIFFDWPDKMHRSELSVYIPLTEKKSEITEEANSVMGVIDSGKVYEYEMTDDDKIRTADHMAILFDEAAYYCRSFPKRKLPEQSYLEQAERFREKAQALRAEKGVGEDEMGLWGKKCVHTNFDPQWLNLPRPANLEEATRLADEIIGVFDAHFQKLRRHDTIHIDLTDGNLDKLKKLPDIIADRNHPDREKGPNDFVEAQNAFSEIMGIKPEQFSPQLLAFYLLLDEKTPPIYHDFDGGGKLTPLAVKIRKQGVDDVISELAVEFFNEKNSGFSDGPPYYNPNARRRIKEMAEKPESLTDERYQSMQAEVVKGRGKAS